MLMSTEVMGAGTYQFRGSLGSFEGVGIRMISLVSCSRRRTFPRVWIRFFSR